MNLGHGESLEWLVHLGDQESLACLVKLEDKVLLVQLECLALRVLMDPEVHLAAGDRQETLECLDWRE